MRALVAGVVALLAAVGAAWGPARADGAVVTWPSPEVAAREVIRDPAPRWTPLLLSSHRPARLRAELPCTLPGGPVRVLSTTSSLDGPGLVLLGDGLSLRASVGGEDLVTVSWPAASASCRGAFELVGDRWSLSRASEVVAEGVVFPPAVSGLWSDLDPLQPDGVRVTVLADSRASRVSWRQWLLVVVSVGALAASVRTMRGDVRGATGGDARSETGGVMARCSGRRPGRPWTGLDRVVVGGLVLWWWTGPWFFDDGWLMGTVRARASAGQFTNYVDSFASPLPLGFAQHALLWPFAALDLPFVWWRVVPLVACIVTWSMLRRALDVVVPDHGRVERAALAATFGLFASGWLLTLRPEPTVAALSSVAVVAALRAAAATGAARVVALTGALTAAAVSCSLHPSGIVAAGALVLVLPCVVEELRRGLDGVVGLVAPVCVAASVGLLLLFADTDVRRWRATRALFAGDGFHSQGVRDELDRYRDLLTNGTAAQLAAVGVGLVALVVLLAARAVSRRPVDGIDRVGVALCTVPLLLALTPSKWTYHFGSGAALVAIGAAAAVGRVRSAGGVASIVAGGAAIAGAVVVAARALHEPSDPQYFWRLDAGVPDVVPVWWPSVLVAVALGALWWASGRRPMLAAGALPAVACVVVVWTALWSALVPTIGGPVWAMGHAGARDAFGGCATADDLAVTDLRRATVARPVGPPPDATARGADPELVAALGVAGAPPGLSLTGSRVGDAGPIAGAWTDVGAGADGDVVVLVGARGAAVHDAIDVEWSTDASAPSAARRVRLDLRDAERSPFAVPAWRLVRIPRSVEGARAVRLVIHDVAGRPDGVLAVTSPMVVPSTSLRSLWRSDDPVLVSPSQLPLLACTRTPDVGNGLAEPPAVVIGFLDGPRPVPIPELGSATGPWFLAEDVVAYETVWLWLDGERAVEVQVAGGAAPSGSDGFELVPPQIRRP